jgi:hypothetical protein
LFYPKDTRSRRWLTTFTQGTKIVNYKMEINILNY